MGRKRGKERTEMSEERAAKKRELAAKYRSRPEVREKQRLRMAEKREATRARRRQWDPPKVVKVSGRSYRTTAPPLSLPLPLSASPELPAEPVDIGADGLSLTPAEQFALTVLAGMAEGHSTQADTSLTMQSRDSPHPPDIRAESPSRGSSVAAVHREPINHERDQVHRWIRGPLPRYLAPETALQKKMRLELGRFGPLTPVQSAQYEAYQLGPQSRKAAEKMKLKMKLKCAPFLSFARWESIRAWREEHLEYDMDWDEDVRAELAEVWQNMGTWTELD
ncbi:hypothetical protein MSAN_00576300 [Mycena sanguinolenta]|uniref:Uncharacterized protein n=1 Tax=Mycena sanguinolenta TaxID=230812 RepID=A0A8H6ZDG7_9AGAR|nr:hypothetical protein MSAN_00576300 [Mycena sanguinolenta]